MVGGDPPPPVVPVAGSGATVPVAGSGATVPGFQTQNLLQDEGIKNNALVGDESVSETNNDKNVFTEYKCLTSVAAVKGVKTHPGKVAEAGSLAAVSLPESEYPIMDVLPAETVEKGKLSSLQCESILYASTQHCNLRGAVRNGFFIGDGTGVGKGRQVAGIVLDNYARGRTRHLWFSVSPDLHIDAKRDMNDIGAKGINVINGPQALDNSQKHATSDGVLFSSYSTLSSAGRLEQIITWARGTGEESQFSGLIVFDECHRMKNSESGQKEGTKVAAAAKLLQARLASARVVYCSATGVSEIGHMGYLDRLGLWGPNCAFENSEKFIQAMKGKGLGFLEMLAMELKAEGKYVARSLSFHDAEFSEFDIVLTTEQERLYNGAVRFWFDMKQAVNEALNATMTEGKVVWKPFWSAQQRFFRLLLVAMKIPGIVEEAKSALSKDCCVVIGMQSTGEAAVNRIKAKHGDNVPFQSTVREILLQFLSEHFPTRMAPEIPQGKGSGGGTAKSLGAFEPSSKQKSEELMQRASELELPNNFLDELIDSLGGTEKVAEITGRAGRIVRSAKGRTAYRLRGKGTCSEDLDSLNVQECLQFMSGKKLVAIVSDAASTGISLHSDARAKNTRRRIHLTIELPWSADKALQQLGRTHRSNQVTPPLYKLVSTNVGGERRFASAVARRLQSLGALTRGDRRAASGIDLTSNNLDTPLGMKALKKMYSNILVESSRLSRGIKLDDLLGTNRDSLGGVVVSPNTKTTKPLEEEQKQEEQESERIVAFHASMRIALCAMGVLEGNEKMNEKMQQTTLHGTVVPSGGGNSANFGVKRFLNRLLGIEVEVQNQLFNYFQAHLNVEIQNAKNEGKWSEGVSDLSGDVMLERDPQVIWKEPSGATTQRCDLIIDRGINFDQALARYSSDKMSNTCGFWRTKRECFGRILYLLALQKPSSSGQKNTQYLVCRPNTGESYYTLERYEIRERYTKVANPEEARDGWQNLYTNLYSQCMHGPKCSVGESCFAGKRLTKSTLLTGSIVAIWGALERVLERNEYTLSKSDRSIRCVRVEIKDGRRFVGVRYPSHLLPEVLALLETLKEAKDHDAKFSNDANPKSSAKRTEAPTPIDKRCLKKALTAPLTMKSFFNPVGVGASAPVETAPVETREGDAPTGDGKENESPKSLPIATEKIDLTLEDEEVILVEGGQEEQRGKAELHNTKRSSISVVLEEERAEKRQREVDADPSRSCPICGMTFLPSLFLSEVNAHIDACLSTTK